MTKVIFKMLEGEVIALFPQEVNEVNSRWIMSYMHIGQHSDASKDLLQELPDATPDQYSDLKKELETLGYQLQILNLQGVKK